jgi:hypothetical protein
MAYQHPFGVGADIEPGHEGVPVAGDGNVEIAVVSGRRNNERFGRLWLRRPHGDQNRPRRHGRRGPQSCGRLQGQRRGRPCSGNSRCAFCRQHMLHHDVGGDEELGQPLPGEEDPPIASAQFLVPFLELLPVRAIAAPERHRPCRGRNLTDLAGKRVVVQAATAPIYEREQRPDEEHVDDDIADGVASNRPHQAAQRVGRRTRTQAPDA